MIIDMTVEDLDTLADTERNKGKLLERNRIVDMIDMARSVLLTDGPGRDMDDPEVAMLTNLMLLITEDDDE